MALSRLRQEVRRQFGPVGTRRNPIPDASNIIDLRGSSVTYREFVAALVAGFLRGKPVTVVRREEVAVSLQGLSPNTFFEYCGGVPGIGRVVPTTVTYQLRPGIGIIQFTSRGYVLYFA